MERHIKLTTADDGQPIYTKACPACQGAGQLEPICMWCNGSGEGQYDGTRCMHCKGDGSEGPYECEPCRGEGVVGASLLDLVQDKLQQATNNGKILACSTILVLEAQDLISEAAELLATCEKCSGRLQLAQEQWAKLDAAAADKCARVAAGGGA